MSEQWSPAVEYDVAYLNGRVAFIIDDHHIPFSAADKLQTQVSSLLINYNEYFKPNTGHAIYEFKVRNTTTEAESEFSIVMCPFAALHDRKLSGVYSLLLRETIGAGVLCAKNAEAMIASRSLYSAGIEKQGVIPTFQLPKLIINIGSGYFPFSSNFYALSKMFEAIQHVDMDIRVVEMIKNCPYCAKMSASPAGSFV